MKTHDTMGRTRRATQRAGNKKLPDKVNAAKSGALGTTPPAMLGDAGKAWWRWATRTMRKMGILDAADGAALLRCASAVNRCAVAVAVIAEEGAYQINNTTGMKSRHPAQIDFEKADAIYGKCLSDFGLTPAARAKLGSTSVKEVDPFEDLIKSKGRN